MTIARPYLFMTLAFSSLLFLSANRLEVNHARTEPFAPETIEWVDSTVGAMSLDEKVQMLFAEVRTADSEPANAELPAFSIARYQDLQQLAPSEVFLSETQLGAIRDSAVLRDYFSALANLCHANGVNFIIGPSLSLLYNDFNPLTVDHSFGDDQQFVAYAAELFIQEFEAYGILVAFDQFPGIGNTERGFDDDAPPLIFSNADALKRKDLVPYKAAINRGVKAIVVGHALVPGVDSSMGQMASNSRAVMHRLLREEMGFQGIVAAELFDPKGRKQVLNPVEFLQKGGQLMLVDQNAESYAREVKLAVEVQMLDEVVVDKACKAVLGARRWITKPARILYSALDPGRKFKATSRKAVRSSMVLLRNENELVPFKRLDTLKIAYVKVGETTPLKADLERYAPTDVYHLKPSDLEADYQKLSPQLPYYNLVIVSIDPEKNLQRKRFGLSEHVQSVADRIANRARTVLVWNGHHKALRFLSSYPNEPAVLLTHSPSAQTDDLAIQTLFGGRAIRGVLRPGIKDVFEPKSGLITSKTRLAYGIPEEVGIDSKNLATIEEIAEKGIREKAYPGCQVWLAKDGVVVVNEAFGNHTYDDGKPVETSDLYDLASITKIAASTAALMRLTDDGLFSLDKNLCDFLPGWVDTTEYMNLNFRDILAHQAGLPAWIPFYSKTLSKGVPRYDIYSLAKSDVYPHRVANNFYIRKDYPDLIFRQILGAKLSSKKKYKYSDVGYYFALRVIERLSETTMDQYLDSTLYAPLGLSTMTYRPLEKFDKDRIVPTEYDRAFRKQLIHGDVHDPGAAMLGGVGGHAGLFSNANDLGILMQMYLQEGEYGYEHYLNPETLSDFIRCQFCDNDNRRGAGFDKPVRDGSPGPTCGCTDREAFGHQGFTGTTTWADPANGVVYVFLSNRVYPSANNRKLLDLNIRTDIQQAFYDAIESSKELAVKNP